MHFFDATGTNVLSVKHTVIKMHLNIKTLNVECYSTFVLQHSNPLVTL